MRTLNLKDPNPFYAPACDECWILLAKEIMTSYANSYSNLFPTNARTQAEYELLDQKKFAPQRKSILRRVKNGPLRSTVDMAAVYSAFENRRMASKKTWGVYWRDTVREDLDRL